MKKFNLELAKAGHKLQTRDGRPARIICYDRKGNKPIVALIYEKEDNVERHHFYFNDGLFLTSTKESPEDLVMATTKKGGWINIYPSNIYKASVSGEVYGTKEEAITCKDENCIDTIRNRMGGVKEFIKFIAFVIFTTTFVWCTYHRVNIWTDLLEGFSLTAIWQIIRSDKN